MVNNGILKGSLITLENDKKLEIENVKLETKILSFSIENIINTQDVNLLQNNIIDEFDGDFSYQFVKNIWTNEVNEYYNINDNLFITKSHFVFCQRNNKYFWIKIENLQLGDLLFKSDNNFEKINSINIINDNVEIYNFEVNSVYTYFANGYLVHNTYSESCDACLVCGVWKDFLFAPYNLAGYGGNGNAYEINDNNNWLSVQNTDDDKLITSDAQWSTDDNSNLNFTDLIDKINSDKGDTTSYPSNGNHFYSERVDLVHNDTKPVYSVRGTLPILDYGQDGEVWFKIEHIGRASGNFSGGDHYALWGIGLMHKFTQNNTDDLTWEASSNVDTFLKPQNTGNVSDPAQIFGDCKVMLRSYGDSNIQRKTREIHAYAKITSTGNSSEFTLNDVSGTISKNDKILGHNNVLGTSNIPPNVTVTSFDSSNNNIILSSSVSFSTSGTSYIGFTKFDHYASRALGGKGFPCGMGFENRGTYDDSLPDGRSKSGKWINTTSLSTFTVSTDQTLYNSYSSGIPTSLANKIVTGPSATRGDLPNISSAGNDLTSGIFGIKITNNVVTFSSIDIDANKRVLLEKELPEFYVDYQNKLRKFSDNSGNNGTTIDGTWSIFVFDSTSAVASDRHVNLRIIKEPPSN